MKNKSNLTTKELLCVALLLAMTFSATANAFAADGDLDLTFGTGGKVVADFSGSSDVGFAMAIQADGKIVVAGTSNASGAGFAVARFNTDGSFDNTFSGDGKLTTLIGTTCAAYAVALQSDGKIVARDKPVFRVAR